MDVSMSPCGIRNIAYCTNLYISARSNIVLDRLNFVD